MGRATGTTGSNELESATGGRTELLRKESGVRAGTASGFNDDWNGHRPYHSPRTAFDTKTPVKCQRVALTNPSNRLRGLLSRNRIRHLYQDRPASKRLNQIRQTLARNGLPWLALATVTASEIVRGRRRRRRAMQNLN